MQVANAARIAKTVADPLAEYESLMPIWRRTRAICSGEGYAKAFDGVVDTVAFSNILIPFSPSMNQHQYNFYKAEAELPGITAEFSKMLVGGLLRKPPQISFPDNTPEEAIEWIKSEFSQDDMPIMTFLDEILWEEIQTSRSWVYVDYPRVDATNLTTEDFQKIKPYPVIWPAETVINWTTSGDKLGKMALTRVIVRGYEEEYDSENEFHPKLVETVKVHELDEEGFYQIRVFQAAAQASNVPVVAGQRVINNTTQKPGFELVDVITDIVMNNKRITMIPAWPLNGQIKPVEPILMAVINKEVSLYNKMSRRNHLLYGASTYTPVISSDMPDEDFEEIVAQGLGTWIRLRAGDTASVLETPTAALADMDRAIAATIEEMARLGIRMLSPETAQSGIALELRNAAQTARLGALSNRIGSTMSQVIAFMLNWRYDLNVKASDVNFKLSEDFNATPLGEGWVRLATEWYQQALIPRSIWLQILKQNDIVPSEYDDIKGREEITEDVQQGQAQQGGDNFASQIQQGN